MPADQQLRQLTRKIETIDRLSAIAGDCANTDRKRLAAVLRYAQQAAAAGDACRMAKAQREIDLLSFRLCED